MGGCLAWEMEESQGLRGEGPLSPPMRLGTHQDLAGLGQIGKSGGEVNRIPDDLTVDPLFNIQLPGDHQLGMDAGMHA